MAAWEKLVQLFPPGSLYFQVENNQRCVAVLVVLLVEVLN